MSKILLIVAIIISLGTAILGYVNKQTLDETKVNLEQAGASLSSTQKTLATTTKELAEKTEALATTTTSKEQAEASLASNEAELGKAKSDLAAAQGEAESNKTAMDGMRTEIADLQQKIADLIAAKPDGGQIVQAEDPEKLAELEALVQSLQNKLDASEANLAELKAKEDARLAQRMKEGLEGRVLAVNPAWNFVVLSIGDKSGVVNNAELLVKRGGQLLGKVRVTAVEPTNSIADIVANSMPAGVSVQPGDTVIYQSSSN